MLVCRNALDMALPQDRWDLGGSCRVLESGKPLREQLLSNPDSARFSPRRQIDAVLDPARPRVCRGVRGPGSETIS